MNTSHWVVGLTVVGLTAVAACSTDDESTGPTTTTTPSTTTSYTSTTSTSDTTSTSSSSSTTSSSCTSDLAGSLGYPAGCDECLADSCCPEAAALAESGAEADALALWTCEHASGSGCVPDCDVPVCNYGFVVFPDCNGCAACLEQNCCDSYLPCVTDGICRSCVLFASFEPASCCGGANELFTPFDDCRASECPQCLGCTFGNTCAEGGSGGTGGTGGGGSGGSGGTGGSGGSGG